MNAPSRGHTANVVSTRNCTPTPSTRARTDISCLSSSPPQFSDRPGTCEQLTLPSLHCLQVPHPHLARTPSGRGGGSLLDAFRPLTPSPLCGNHLAKPSSRLIQLCLHSASTHTVEFGWSKTINCLDCSRKFLFSSLAGALKCCLPVPLHFPGPSSRMASSHLLLPSPQTSNMPSFNPVLC